MHLYWRQVIWIIGSICIFLSVWCNCWSWYIHCALDVISVYATWLVFFSAIFTLASLQAWCELHCSILLSGDAKDELCEGRFCAHPDVICRYITLFIHENSLLSLQLWPPCPAFCATLFWTLCNVFCRQPWWSLDTGTAIQGFPVSYFCTWQMCVYFSIPSKVSCCHLKNEPCCLNMQAWSQTGDAAVTEYRIQTHPRLLYHLLAPWS
jgi:hypothetical protein